ncbi:MAG: hypothetical protein JWP59_2313 [Massilia sp.]|nr:hypothetical protein [Massilia sp.]
MYKQLLWTVLALAALPHDGLARQLPALTRLAVQARADVPDLKCEPKAATPRTPASPNPDPMEMPTAELVESLALPPALPPAPPYAASALPLPTRPLRIAIWGDSHLAANFFTEELSKQWEIPADASMHALIPANMGRAGVRLPLRQSCVSPQWKYELAYLGGENASAPGPGLVNMVSAEAGASLAWDVRKPGQRGPETVRILYQQTAAPLLIGLQVDGGPEREITLAASPGPAILELAAEQPISQLAVRLIDGRLRFHGLALMAAQASPYVMDVFGYPGSTVAGWKHADLAYLSSWFAQRDDQLVMLEFGTNEGNVKPFDAAGYRRILSESVQNLKTVFPRAACVLIAPGDRGVLVPRSANLRTKKAARGGPKQARPGKAAAIDLYLYAKIHAEIGRIEAQVGGAAGCGVWSMQTAMGGPGSAYDWARQSPPLMAKDLIHFTVAGYQRLARMFARDMGWRAGPGGPP